MNKGFIFDMNGTMIDDMSYHLKAWGDIIINELGAEITPEQLKLHMYGKNEEVLDRIFGEGKFAPQEVDKISKRKEDAYQEAFKPNLKLIKGLDIFLKQAHDARIPMGIGTAAIPYNLNFVLDNLNLHHYFISLVTADDVTESKPHPETFLNAAEQMGVAPENCIVFEDSPKGIEAAQNAGMKAVAVTTMHDEADFAGYNNVLFFIKDYTDPRLTALLKS